MITSANLDIAVLPHGDFCSVAAIAGGAKEVIVPDDATGPQLCALADECVAWARQDPAAPAFDALYYRAWRLMAKARHWALWCVDGHPLRTSVNVAIAREGDQLVACFTVHVDKARS